MELWDPIKAERKHIVISSCACVAVNRSDLAHTPRAHLRLTGAEPGESFLVGLRTSRTAGGGFAYGRGLRKHVDVMCEEKLGAGSRPLFL